MIQKFSQKFFQKFLFIPFLLGLFFSASTFAFYWDNSGTKYNSSQVDTSSEAKIVYPGNKLTFGAYDESARSFSIYGFSGNYSPVFSTNTKNFYLKNNRATFNHYIKSNSSAHKIRLKKVNTRSGYYPSPKKNNLYGSCVDGQGTSYPGYSQYCFHAEVEAVCTKPGGGYVYQGNSYREYVTGGRKTYTCQSNWTFSESLSCYSGYHKEGNSCVSNSKSCTVSHGLGTQTWNGSWGSCVITGCDRDYYKNGSKCTLVEVGWYSPDNNPNKGKCENGDRSHLAFRYTSRGNGTYRGCSWDCKREGVKHYHKVGNSCVADERYGVTKYIHTDGESTSSTISCDSGYEIDYSQSGANCEFF